VHDRRVRRAASISTTVIHVYLFFLHILDGFLWFDLKKFYCQLDLMPDRTGQGNARQGI
jgi:hypothetical protein